ncbi:MAG: hypothetical protein WAZ18_03525 [Alphaproteobacteria bacterium]
MRSPSNLFTPPVMAVVQALLPAPTKAVGGSVRCLLLGHPMAQVDVDLATEALPDEIEQRLRRAKIPFDAQGKRWGSFTAKPAPGVEVDITSLRADSYLPGSRYPNVNFGVGWEADAARRDFTIGAIYMAPDGTLTDPLGGEADLKAGLVRFIGDPAQRLREDPLRLLRFYRFCGQYGLAGITEDLKPVLAQAAPALATLSAARKADEFAKLAKTPHAVSVSTAMEALGVAVPVSGG